jgi:hypothetical protein
VKQSDPGPHVDLVMIQVELPPYHGPHSPLDLIASEIVFGRMFESFCWVSQAKSVAAGPVPADDDKSLQKRQRQAPLVRKMPTLK